MFTFDTVSWFVLYIMLYWTNNIVHVEKNKTKKLRNSLLS